MFLNAKNQANIISWPQTTIFNI